jgi:hypothetical protein
VSECRKQGRGHKIPSGTEPMRMRGAPKVDCEVWYIKDFDFAVYTKDGLIVLRHHEPERLIGALLGPNVKRIELATKLEVIRVHLDEPGIPRRFYMTSGVLSPCSS